MGLPIAIIGTGYVGLVTGVCMACLGNNVICYDIDETKIRRLKKGHVPFYEPGLEELLIRHRGQISFTTHPFEALSNAIFVFICVGTPPKKTGGADMSFYLAALEKIREVVSERRDQSDVYIINKSTVPVGTAKRASDFFAKLKTKVHIISNPEFLREGKAVEDFMKPDRVVIGFDKLQTESIEPVLNLFTTFRCLKIATDWESAELIKYASNAYLATKISFINEISNLCERVGANIKVVAEGMGSDPRIGKQFLQAGIGYGGSCFPKDARALEHLSNVKNYRFRLLKSVIEVNNQQRLEAIKKITAALKGNLNPTVTVLGMAFKPDTDDIRESAGIFIISELLKRGLRVKASDPFAVQNAKILFKNRRRISFFIDPYQASANSDVLFLATEWRQFIDLNWKKVKSVMRGHVIIDGRNALDSELLKQLGFSYVGFGF